MVHHIWNHLPFRICPQKLKHLCSGNKISPCPQRTGKEMHIQIQHNNTQEIWSIFLIGSNHVHVPLLFYLRKGTVCVLEIICFNFYFTCGTMGEVQKWFQRHVPVWMRSLRTWTMNRWLGKCWSEELWLRSYKHSTIKAGITLYTFNVLKENKNNLACCFRYTSNSHLL